MKAYTTTYPLKKMLAIYMAWWIFWTVIQSIVLHRLEFSWKVSSIDAIVTNGLLALASFVTIIIFRFYQPGSANRLYRLAFALSIAVLYNISFKWIITYFLGTEIYYLDFLEKSMPIRFIISLLVLTFLTITNWLLYNLQEQKEKEQRQNIAEQLAKEAELAKLRQQLQPHFLFNSLNSISALAGTKPNEARKMIQQLSDFLRGTLKKDDQQYVSLSEEIEHLNLYLEIEKVRFGHRLNIDMYISPDSFSYQLPPLLLQPIVENAIKFGLYGTIGGITISITTRIENHNLYITITNPFDPDTQYTNQGTGFGLNSIQRRLFLLYARNDLMTTEKTEHSFITSLKIPQPN